MYFQCDLYSLVSSQEPFEERGVHLYLKHIIASRFPLHLQMQCMSRELTLKLILCAAYFSKAKQSFILSTKPLLVQRAMTGRLCSFRLRRNLLRTWCFRGRIYHA